MFPKNNRNAFDTGLYEAAQILRLFIINISFVETRISKYLGPSATREVFIYGTFEKTSTPPVSVGKGYCLLHNLFTSILHKVMC